MHTLDNAIKKIKDRGPRYAVEGTIRPREIKVSYADTADRAEQIRREFEDDHHHQIRVHPPEGSVDLATLGGARHRAKRAYDDATAVLRSAVLRAAESGRAEAEIARTAQVDRMTVRNWLGKR